MRQTEARGEIICNPYAHSHLGYKAAERNHGGCFERDLKALMKFDWCRQKSSACDIPRQLAEPLYVVLITTSRAKALQHENKPENR